MPSLLYLSLLQPLYILTERPNQTFSRLQHPGQHSLPQLPQYYHKSAEKKSRRQCSPVIIMTSLFLFVLVVK